jgi:glycosyltransferase involved in cell wall biosynthesis
MNTHDHRSRVASDAFDAPWDTFCAEPATASRPRRRIAVIASYTPSLTNFRLELLKRMVESDCEVFAFAPENDPVVIAQLRSVGVSFVQIDMGRAGLNPLADLKTLLSLWRQLRRLKPDLVLPYTMKPIIYGGIAARLAGQSERSFLVTGLGHVFSEAVNSSLKLALVRRLSVLLYRFALRNAKVVFAYNSADAEDIERYRLIGGRTPLVLVPGSGVDLDHFANAEIPEGPVTFLLIARLLKDKGIFDYVEAARRLRAEYPQAQFQLLGHFDPNPTAISRQQIDAWTREGLIHYLGETTDVRPYLAACSAFVLPSYYREGIPRSILEAMATGRAIVTTNLPGCRDTVEEGINGFTVEPQNPGQLADSLRTFLHDPSLAQRMGARSRQIAEAKFDVHHVNRILLKRMGLVS